MLNDLPQAIFKFRTCAHKENYLTNLPSFLDLESEKRISIQWILGWKPVPRVAVLKPRPTALQVSLALRFKPFVG